MSTSCSGNFCPTPNIEWNKPIKIGCGNGQSNNTPRSRVITSINGGNATDLLWIDVVPNCAGTTQYPQGSCPYYTNGKNWCGTPGSAEACNNGGDHCWKAGLVWSDKPSHAWFYSPTPTDQKDGYNDSDLRVTQLDTKNCSCSTGNQECPGCANLNNGQGIANCCVNDPNPANNFQTNSLSGTSNMGACRFGYSAGATEAGSNNGYYSGCTMLESSLADTGNQWHYISSAPANAKNLTSTACSNLTNTVQGVSCSMQGNSCVCKSASDMNSVVCNSIGIANKNNGVLCGYDSNSDTCTCVNATSMMPGYLVSAVHKKAGPYAGYILGDQSPNNSSSTSTYQNNMCGSDGSSSNQQNILGYCSSYYQNAYNQGKNLGHIDIENAVKCCSLGSTDISNNINSGWAQYPLCQGAFNPGGTGNKCQPLMTSFCEKYWDSQDSEISDVCTNFIKTSPIGPSSVEQMLITYLNSRTGCDPGYCSSSTGVCSSSNPSQTAQPVDYVSPNIANPNGTSAQKVAYQFYKNNNACDFTDDKDNCIPICKYDGNDAPGCIRDDSANPFFTTTLPQMVNDAKMNPSANNSAQACDNILQAFCQSMTRDDINADISAGSMTLMDTCGCHLKPINGTVTTPTNPIKMCPITAQAPSKSPYYTNTAGGQACDPLCLNSTIQNCLYSSNDGPDKCACTAQQCIIDNVTINEVNSSTGGINLSQSCNGGQCYISNVTVNAINSGVSGNIDFFQDCGSCYTFTGGNLSTAQQIDCGTLQPTVINPPSPPTPSFYQKYKVMIWIGIILVILIAVVMIYFMTRGSKDTTSVDVSEALQNYFEQ